MPYITQSKPHNCVKKVVTNPLNLFLEIYLSADFLSNLKSNTPLLDDQEFPKSRQ